VTACAAILCDSLFAEHDDGSGVATRNEQRPYAPARNYRNWKVWFWESDDPVLSRLTAVWGTARLQQSAPPPTM
jgi:hypothetical protein